MSYEIKEKVVRVEHVDGCSKNKSCGPACVRITDGWRVDYHLMYPGARWSVRKRERIPSEWADTKNKRNQWAKEREAALVARGREEDSSKANITVRQLIDKWLDQREGEGADVEKDRQRLLDHVSSVLGALRVVEVRPRHVHDLVMKLKRTPSKRGGLLAPRTIRQIFFTTRQLFTYAVLQEIIVGNPIIVGRGVVPKKADKVPGWRKTAVFTRSEVETLISSDAIPWHRRVLYALLFLTGLRPGQAYEARWGDYEAEFTPLGRLSSFRSWNSNKKIVKPTKTGVDHLIPVHPVLAKILAEWKLHGWPARHGKKPKQADLIVPTINGTQRDARRTYMDLQEDLENLGLRKRRQYDSRRTFASLAISGGASKELVRTITHPRPADVFDDYVTATWESLCGAVGCIKVEVKTGEVVSLRPITKSDGTQVARGDDAAPGKEETPQLSRVTGLQDGGV